MHLLKMSRVKECIRVGSDVVLKNKEVSMVSLEELNELSSIRCKLLSLYKRFYKLRNMVDSKSYNKETYHNLIRRKFLLEDFLERRSILLGDCKGLTENQLFGRMINTLAFVHNSTVYLPTEKQDDPVLFFEDLKKPQRIEKLVILTMLKMDEQKPPQVKYDRKYEWLTKINNQFSQIPQDASVKEYRKAFKDTETHLIGFRDYELNLMRLNECYDLCL